MIAVIVADGMGMDMDMELGCGRNVDFAAVSNVNVKGSLGQIN